MPSDELHIAPITPSTAEEQTPMPPIGSGAAAGVAEGGMMVAMFQELMSQRQAVMQVQKQITDLAKQHKEEMAEQERRHQEEIARIEQQYRADIARCEQRIARLEARRSPQLTPEERWLQAQKVLFTTATQKYWDKLRKAHLVDEQYQPTGLSNSERAYVAHRMSEVLLLKEKWKYMQCFWHTTNLAKYYQDYISTATTNNTETLVAIFS